MTGEKFRDMLKAQPFRPFFVKTIDGDTLRVEHSDYALVTPKNREVIIFDKDEHYRWVAMNHIVSLEPTPQRSAEAEQTVAPALRRDENPCGSSTYRAEVCMPHIFQAFSRH